MKKATVILILTAVLAIALVAVLELGLITVDNAGKIQLQAGVAALFVAFRTIWAMVKKIGLGKKTIPSGIAMLLMAVVQAYGIAVPEFVFTILTYIATLGAGDAIGLMKPVPKLR